MDNNREFWNQNQLLSQEQQEVVTPPKKRKKEKTFSKREWHWL